MLDKGVSEIREINEKVDELHRKVAEEMRKQQVGKIDDHIIGFGPAPDWWTTAVEQQKENDMMDEEMTNTARDAYPVQATHEVLMNLEELETKIKCLRDRLGVILKPRLNKAVPDDGPMKPPQTTRSPLMSVIERASPKITDLDNMVQLIIEDLDL